MLKENLSMDYFVNYIDAKIETNKNMIDALIDWKYAIKEELIPAKRLFCNIDIDDLIHCANKCYAKEYSINVYNSIGIRKDMLILQFNYNNTVYKNILDGVREALHIQYMDYAKNYPDYKVDIMYIQTFEKIDFSNCNMEKYSYIIEIITDGESQYYGRIKDKEILRKIEKIIIKLENESCKLNNLCDSILHIVYSGKLQNLETEILWKNLSEFFINNII